MVNHALAAVRQPLLGQLGDKIRRLRFQGGRQHVARALAGNLGQRIEDRSGLAERGDRGIFGHRRIVPFGRSGRFQLPPRYAAFSGTITQF